MFVKPFYLFFFIIVIALITFLAFPSSKELGKIYFSSYKYKKAKTILDEVIRKEGKDIGSLEKLAEYNLIQGHTRHALQIYQKISELKPHNMIFLDKLIQLHDWVGQPYERLKVSERKIPLVPYKEQAKIIRTLADGYRWLKKYDDANRMFGKLQAYSKDLGAMTYLADYYLSTQQVELAIRYLFQYLGQDGTQYLYSTDFLGDDLKRIKNQKSVLMRIIQIYTDMKKVDLAIPLQETLCQSLPYSVNCLFNLADLYNYDKQVENEVKTLQKIERLKPSISLYRRIADTLESLSDLDGAITYYQKVEYLNPNNVNTLWIIAKRFEGQDKMKAAIYYLEKILKIEPHNKKVLYYLAKKYEETEQLSRAIQIYQKILKLEQKKGSTFIIENPDFLYSQNIIKLADNSSWYRIPRGPAAPFELPGFPKSFLTRVNQADRVVLKLIQLYEANNQGNKAIRLYLKLLRKFPSEISLLKGLALQYEYNDRPRMAAELHEVILKKEPKNIKALQFLYTYSTAKSKYQEAKKYFQRYQQLVPQNTFTFHEFFHLEEMYQTDHKHPIYQKACKKILSEHIKAWHKNLFYFYPILRCINHFLPKKRYSHYSQFLKKHPLKHNIRSDLVDLLVQDRYLRLANIHLDYLILYRAFNQRNRVQRNYIYELIREQTKHQLNHLDITSQLNLPSENPSWHSQLSYSKGFSTVYRGGFKLDYLNLMSSKEHLFGVTPLLRILQSKFILDISLPYLFSYSKFPLYFAFSYIALKETYASLSLEVNKIPFTMPRALLEQLYQDRLQLYGETSHRQLYFTSSFLIDRYAKKSESTMLTTLDFRVKYPKKHLTKKWMWGGFLSGTLSLSQSSLSNSFPLRPANQLGMSFEYKHKIKKMAFHHELQSAVNQLSGKIYPVINLYETLELSNFYGIKPLFYYIIQLGSGWNFEHSIELRLASQF